MVICADPADSVRQAEFISDAERVRVRVCGVLKQVKQAVQAQLFFAVAFINFDNMRQSKRFHVFSVCFFRCPALYCAAFCLMKESIMKDDKLKGVFWAGLSMVLWASSFPVGRTLISNQMTDPVTLGMLRFGLGGVLMLAFGPFLKLRGLFRFSIKDGVCLALLGLLGTALMAIFLFTAQKTISSVNSSMIEALSPLLIFILNLCLTRRFSAWQAAGLLFGFGGCLMVLKVVTFDGFYLESYQFGDFLILCSSLCWSLYSVLGRPVIMRVGAYKFTAWTMLFGALWLLVIDIADYDAVICANDFTAISLVRNLLAAYPQELERLLIIGCAETCLTEYYSPYILSIRVNFQEYGKAAVTLLENLKRNPYLSHAVMSIRWDFSPLTSLRKLDGGARDSSPASIPESRDIFYQDTELSGMLRLERMLNECDSLDREIIECLLREESYDSISESCFVTVSTIKYRVKKMIGTAEAADRRDLIRLLREYLP